jgi:FixJ family two-component response regulator
LCREGLDIPSIVITAEGFLEARVQALEAGAVAFLHKPFDDDALLDLVRSDDS